MIGSGTIVDMDGNTVVSTDSKGVHLYDVLKGYKTDTVQLQDNEKPRYISVCDNVIAVSYYDTLSVRVWIPPAVSKIVRFHSKVEYLSVCPGYLVVVMMDMTICVYNLIDNTSYIFTGHGGWKVMSLKTLSNGRVVIGMMNGEVITFECSRPSFVVNHKVLTNKSERKGKNVLIMSNSDKGRDEMVRIVKGIGAIPVFKLERDDVRNLSCVVTPVLVGSENLGVTKSIPVFTYDEFFQEVVVYDAANAVAAFGDLIVSGHMSGLVCVWNYKTDEQYSNKHNHKIESVAVSDSMICSVTIGRTVKVWSKTMQLTHIFKPTFHVYKLYAYGDRLTCLSTQVLQFKAETVSLSNMERPSLLKTLLSGANSNENETQIGWVDLVDKRKLRKRMMDIGTTLNIDAQGHKPKDSIIAVLADIIAVNSTIKTLKMNFRECSEPGIRYIANALIRNTSIHTLFISTVNDDDYSYITNLLNYNRTLKKLIINNNMDPSGLIHDRLRLNRNMKKWIKKIKTDKCVPESGWKTPGGREFALRVMSEI